MLRLQLCFSHCSLFFCLLDLLAAVPDKGSQSLRYSPFAVGKEAAGVPRWLETAAFRDSLHFWRDVDAAMVTASLLMPTKAGGRR